MSNGRKEEAGSHRKVRTYSCSESEFEIVRTESVILDCCVDDLIQQGLVAKEIFSDAQPYAE
jgi:hypothetical protein